MSEAKKFHSVSSGELPHQLLDLLIKCEMLQVTVTLLCAWKYSRWLKAASHINKSVYVCCKPACFGASYCVNNTYLNSRVQTVPKSNKKLKSEVKSLSHFLLPQDSNVQGMCLNNKTNRPGGAQVGAGAFAIYTTWALALKTKTASAWN